MCSYKKVFKFKYGVCVSMALLLDFETELKHASSFLLETAKALFSYVSYTCL